MEAKLGDRSLSPSKYKQIKNSKAKAQNHHLLLLRQQEVARSSSIARQASNMNVQLEKVHGHGHGGVFLNPTAPFPLSSSLSLPANYIYHPNPTTLFPNHHHKNIHQPPLLPLPISQPIFHSLPPHVTHNKQPLSPLSYRKQTNKTKPKNPNPKRVTASKPAPTKTKPPPPGGDGDGSGGSVDDKVTIAERLEERPKDVFSLSPPPSSLPLPKFSLRQPKLSCTVEAAAARDQVVDDGATDNLFRMLRLR